MYLVDQKVVNGNEIPYQIKGKGPLLVMIHGGGLDRKMWTPQVKALSKKFRVLTYDIRGHGAYDLKDNSGYEIDDLKGILDALKPDKIYLVGHSLGSMLATDFVLAYPELVEKLVLISPPLSGFKKERPELIKLLERYNELMDKKDEANHSEEALEILTKIAHLGPNRKASDIDTEVYAYVKESLERHVKEELVFNAPVLKFEDHLSKIQLIKQSGLLIYGELDFQYIKDNATKLKQELPDVRIQAIEGAAHFA